MKYQSVEAKTHTLDFLHPQRLLSSYVGPINADKQIGVTKVTPYRRQSPIFLTVMIAIVLSSAPLVAWADDDDEIPYDEAELFFELNDTDGDLGIHALIDGDAWKRLVIKGPNGRKMLDVEVKGRLKKQGLTEIFFESAEPTFDELDPEDFFRRFPAGKYQIKGKTLEGEKLKSEVELTHVMPAPADVTVNDKPMALQCDEDADGFDATQANPPVTIAWAPVTLSHPDASGAGAGVQPPVDVTIHNYEVVLEVLDADEAGLSVHLPPGETSFTVPEEFLSLGDEYKYEVLAREESFNQTAVESCFVLVE